MMRTLRNRNSDTWARRILKQTSTTCDQRASARQSADHPLARTIRLHRPVCFRYLSSTPSGSSLDLQSGKNSTDWPCFCDLEQQLSPGTRKALHRAGLVRMTEIQARALEPILNGKDVIARARTGTGKTMAFLVPAIERILHQQHKSGKDVKPTIALLIVSPTRELAEQIYREALVLTQQHASITCHVMYGGVPKRLEIQRLQTNIPSILIATPGRLMDHLESTVLRDNLPFADCLSNTPMLVLDEVDRLLEMGFSKDIMEIQSYLPAPQDRQTLLFSATMPLTVQETMQACVRSNDTSAVMSIDCVQDHDPRTHTSSDIEQTYVLLPPHRLVSGIIELILNIKRKPTCKTVVFFPTTAQVEFYHHLLTSLGHRVYQIHSKLNQAMRLTASDQFRYACASPNAASRAGGPVLLTTDLSARGVDYPDVTHVVQVGAANNRESYLHRLGRTGRAGKTGQGVLVLVDLELGFLQQDLAGLNIEPNHRLQGILDGNVPAVLQDDLMRIQFEMRTGQADDLSESAVDVYKSILGYYSTRLRSLGVRSSDLLVELVNAFASDAGLVELPVVSERLARQCGLLGNNRIRVDARWTPGSLFHVSGKPAKPKCR